MTYHNITYKFYSFLRRVGAYINSTKILNMTFGNEYIKFKLTKII